MSLTICGLGLDPRRDATLESLEALASCAAVYTDVESAEAFRWLAPLCPGLKRSADAAEVVRSAESGEVGLAVWGHPRYASAFARQVERLCARAKVACRVLAANSPLGSLVSRSATFLGGDEGVTGMRDYELADFLKNPPKRIFLPCVIHAETGADSAPKAEVLARLRGLLPAGHRVMLYESSGRCESAALADLSWSGVGAGALFLSAVMEKRRWRSL